MSLLLLALAFAGGQTVAKPVPRELKVWVSRDVAPSSRVRLNINTRNLPVVHVTSSLIDGLKWLAQPHKDLAPAPKPVRPVGQFNLTIAQQGQVTNPTDNYFSRQVNLPPMKPGVYLLTLTAGGKSAWAVVNVTNLAVVVKRSPSRSLVWVTEYKSGNVVPNAAVRFFDAQGKPTRSASTGKDGVAVIPMLPSVDMLVVSSTKDMAGVQTSSANPDGRLDGIFQTDRPIYRPGQTIQYKAALRLTHGQGYDPVTTRVTAIQLRDPRDNPIDEQKVTSNVIGSVAGSFKIPEEGMLGAYSLVLTCDKQSIYHPVTVAAYRKPEFKVDVKPLQRRYLAGEDIHFSVDTAYYFGAALPQAQVEWTVRSSPMPFDWGDDSDQWASSGDGNMYPRDTYASQPFAGEGQVVTDNKGHAEVTIHSNAVVPDSTYTVSLIVTDGSRRQVTGGTSVPVYSADLRLGLVCLRQAVAVGDLIPVQVRAVDLDGKPRAATLRLELTSEVFDEKTGKNNKRVLTRKTVAVASNGQTTVNVPALEFGDLQITVTTKDRTGRKATASVPVWVAGIDYKPVKDENPQLEVRLDKSAYRPGDTVHGFFTTNRPKRPMLLFMTGRDIWDYKVVLPGKSMVAWTLKTTTAESPTAYVSADQWTETGLEATNAVVPLPDLNKLLNVQVKSERPEYKPGDKARFHVRTLNHEGKGVPAEVGLSVVDESIYALSSDTNLEPFRHFWGPRPDQVVSFESSPQELEGGAYQRVSSVAPIRQRFEDTAYWNAFVKTDANGDGEVTFEMPGNLTSWRATGRAVTGDTHVGVGRTNVTATRPVTLRLATPRMVSQGDVITVIGTVNNRSPKAMTFDLDLSPEGVAIEGETKRQVLVAGNSEGTVGWKLEAKDVPASGLMRLTARVGANGSTDPDFGDALSVSVPVVPRGVSATDLVGGTITTNQSVKLDLPSDSLPQGSMITVRLSGGVQARVRESAAELMANGRFGTMWAVDALKAAVAIDGPKTSDEVREALALISRDQQPGGWGWWQQAPVDPKITAEVGYALAIAAKHGYRVFDRLKQAALQACLAAYPSTNLWEDRARFAATLMLLGAQQAPPLMDEVLERGQNISPFAKLRMAEALSVTSKSKAQKQIDEVLALVSDGPASAYVPTGIGIGWNASDEETTAELLNVLNLTHQHSELQSRLARRLTIPEPGEYLSSEDTAAAVLALSLYGKEHPDAKTIGNASATINGHEYALAQSTVDESAGVEVRESVLRGGANDVQLRRSGSGEALFTVQARYYRPSLSESVRGVRVTRRFEVRNAAGVWVETSGVVKPGEPVRCTVVVWGDDISDALKLTEPIPAGFEYVDSDFTAYAEEEVRDGALVHYLINSGTPTYFRYYLRAEADGSLVALPATATYLRRPANRGNSAASEFLVHK